MEREISIFPGMMSRGRKLNFNLVVILCGLPVGLIAVFSVPSAHWASKQLPKFVTGKGPISFFWLGIRNRSQVN
jgi:hypothetical protein